MTRVTKILIGAGVALVIFLIALIFFRPWGFVENYELGYKFNKLTGQIEVLPHTGYNARTPIVEAIHTVDLRPRQVCLTVGDNPDAAGNSTSDSPNRRVLNCKLVRFNPAGLSLFLSWHGRDDYYGRTLDDLLKIYAYDPRSTSYPFLTILPSSTDGMPAPAPAPAQ